MFHGIVSRTLILTTIHYTIPKTKQAYVLQWEGLCQALFQCIYIGQLFCGNVYHEAMFSGQCVFIRGCSLVVCMYCMIRYTSVYRAYSVHVLQIVQSGISIVYFLYNTAFFFVLYHMWFFSHCLPFCRFLIMIYFLYFQFLWYFVYPFVFWLLLGNSCFILFSFV